MDSWVVIPKIDMGGMAEFRVQPNGWPVPDFEQGENRVWGASREMKEAVCVRKGNRYKYRILDTRMKKEVFMIYAFGCNVKLTINYGRPITPEDLTPKKIALALDSLLEVEGLPVGDDNVLGLLEEQLNRIVVDGGRTDFLTISFDNPLPRHEIDPKLRRIHFHTDSLQSLLSERDLTVDELRAGPELLLQESLPLAALAAARRVDAGSRVLSISALQSRGPLRYTWADVVVSGRYEHHLWIMHGDRAKLYTLVSKGSQRDQGAVAAITERVTASLDTTGSNSAGDLAAELPTPADRLPRPSSQPEIGDFSVQVEPARVRRGAMLNVPMTFSVSSSSPQVDYSETRTLRYDGRVLPNYPQRKSGTLPPGRHTSTYTEAIPDAAPLGVYECESEVCLGKVCRSGIVLFQVTGGP